MKPARDLLNDGRVSKAKYENYSGLEKAKRGQSVNLDIRYGRRFACRWKGRNSTRPKPRASGGSDRVEAKSPDGDDPEEDGEHDELRLLERRLGLPRRERVQGRHATKRHDDEDQEVEVAAFAKATACRGTTGEARMADRGW